MKFEQYVNMFANPDDAAKYISKNFPYKISGKYEERHKSQMASSQDLVKDFTSNLLCDKGGACGEFAAAPVAVARAKGFPGGIIHVGEKGAKTGHMLGWWANPDGTVRTISAEGPGKINTKSYKSYDDMYNEFYERRLVKRNEDVYFGTDTGEYLFGEAGADPKTVTRKAESDWLSQTREEVSDLVKRNTKE